MLFSYPNKVAVNWVAIMLAYFAVGFKRGVSPITVTNAFSIATVGTTIASNKAASVASHRVPSTFGGAAPFRRLFGGAPIGGGVSSISSAIADTETTIELEKTLEVTHPAYDVIKKDVVCEYGAYCTMYKHKKSGAELLSVATDDDNKVFGITFRTPPEDSRGVAHILEHSVLCGSRKYTTKDPFVQLLQGSLQTFLNAMTYPDRTCYIVASQNLKDFYNLVNVYSDAVFHPRAISDPMVHAQEGWHLELENKEDPLTYKGVVYNEMKGVYSSPDSLLNRASQRSVFPDNTYAVDSGGDPADIPDLSYEQFVDFHRKFYHPANSRIYFSGNDETYDRLDIMDEYLKDFDETPESRTLSEIEWQTKKFDTPKHEVHPYPLGPDQPETHMVNVNWLLNDTPLTDLEEVTLGILDHLLLGTTSSVLYKTLMGSSLGEAITGGGLSDQLLQNTFSLGLKGVKAENVKDVETLILDTLNKVVQDGFTEEEIASSMNTVEFQLREFNTGSFPKGLSFMLGSMTKWIYGQSPTDALKFEEPLAELKKNIEESGSQIFQDMLKKFFTTNMHRSTVELKPSQTYEDEVLKEEEERLAKTKSSLSDSELDEIVSKTNELKKLQATEDSLEDRATIPSLELEDLTLKESEYPIDVTKNENDSGITVIRHQMASTSGIAYVNLGVDISMLSLNDLPLLSIFTRMLMETGAGDYNSVELAQQMGTHTGGIGITMMKSAVHPEGVDESVTISGEQMITKLMIQGKATTDKVDKLFSLMNVILTDAKFKDSQSRVLEMLKESKSRLQSGIQSSGHSVANQRMIARYRVSGYINEIMGGITYLETLKELIKEAEEDWPSLLAKLENMRTKILTADTCRDGMFFDVTGDSTVLKTIKPNIDNFLKILPGDPLNGKEITNFYREVHPWVAEAKQKMETDTPLIDEGFVVSTQVSYVGKGGLIYEEGETVSGASQVVSRFLKTGYLWDHVRVIGGAYGGFCTFSPFSGFFSFLSYRDPNLSKTLDVYDAAADALLAAADTLENDEEALATAIIGTIGDRDGVLSPDAKGYVALQRYLINESSEARQKVRDEILQTKPSDFRDFALRLKSIKNPSIAVVSSKAAFETAEKEGKTMTLQDIV